MKQSKVISYKARKLLKAIVPMALLLAITTSQPASAGFQETLWGARPAGLAGTFSALADDANAPAYNPAGISLIPHNEITIMYAQLFTGLDLQAGDQTSDLGLSYFSYVPQISRKRYGSYAISWARFAATNLIREDSFYLTYADSHQFDSSTKPLFAYGANLKFLRRSFSTDHRTANDPVFRGGRDANALTADVGLIFKPRWTILPGLKFGLAGQNVTEPDLGLSSSDKVSAKYVLGVAYQEKNMRALNPALELSRRRGRTIVSFGLESWLARDSLALRVGGNEDQLAGGMGYQFLLFSGLMMRIDYSLLWPMDIDGTNGDHRFSITTNF